MKRTACLLFLATWLGNTEAFAECRTFDAGAEIAVLADSRLDEASGIAASWRNEGIFWVHNDSGDSARVFAIDIAGQTQTVLELAAPAAAEDWEDITVGPCEPNGATPCVWVADIGDNDEERPNVVLYRFEEPQLDGPPASMVVDEVTAITVTYEGGPRNAETLMVHPVDGRVFIVDKTVGDPTNLWLVRTDGIAPATRVASTSFGEVGIVSGRVTGGDFAPSGDEYSLRTYHFIYTFCGDDPIEAFDAPRSSVIGTNLFQSEALTYTRDAMTMLTTSEVQSSERPPILQMRIDDAAVDPDAGTAPMPDADMTRRMEPAVPNGGMDVDVQLVDEYNKSSCSCGVTSAPNAIGVLLLGGFLCMGRRRRRRS